MTALRHFSTFFLRFSLMEERLSPPQRRAKLGSFRHFFFISGEPGQASPGEAPRPATGYQRDNAPAGGNSGKLFSGKEE
jgi:hypothetical protein